MAKIVHSNVKTVADSNNEEYSGFDLSDIELTPFNLAVAAAPIVFAISPRLFLNGIVIGLFTQFVLNAFESKTEGEPQTSKEAGDSTEQ